MQAFSQDSSAQDRTSGASRRNIARASGLRELDSTYRKRSPKFFTTGRVFRALWTEPAGETRGSGGVRGDLLQTGYAQEAAFSKIRPFVVIKPCQEYSIALAITTYNGQGVTKPAANKSDHAVVYTGSSEPIASGEEQPGQGEQPMRSPGIRVVSDKVGDSLHIMSRLDFGRHYTIHHWQRVEPFGNVHPSFLPVFRDHFNAVFRPLGEPQSAIQPPQPDQTPHQTLEEQNPMNTIQDQEEGPSRQVERYDSRVKPVFEQPAEEAARHTMASLSINQARAAVARLQADGYQPPEAVEQILRFLEARLSISRDAALQYLFG